MADAGTGNYGLIRISTSVTPNEAGNYWDIAWAAYLYEQGGPNLSYDNVGTAFSIVIGTVGTVSSGGFTWDWRPGGLQGVLIAASTTRVYANPDGSVPAGIYVQLNIGSTGTSGAGGPSSVTEYPSLSALHVLPSTPSSVVATRISDTADTLSWAQSSAANGQPVTNTVRAKVNGGAWADVVTIAAATSVNLTTAANQKVVYGVKATNSVGDTAYSADSPALFTTPAAPTSVVATKSGSDIAVTFVDNVAFTEHSHVLEHGVDVAGVVTWDGSPLATITAGTLSYTHSAPNPAQKHVYRLRAKNTDTAALSSSTVQSNTVQLLTAPGKPTVPAPAPYQDKAATFRFAWVHNPIDTTVQTKRQVRYSTDGGSTWTTGSKTTDANQYLDFAGSTWAANAAVTFQVRTKGGYDAGADADASYSPWSDSVTVTFKTKPVVTIPTPANSSTYVQAALTVVLGFTQAEAATFVSAALELWHGADLLESLTSTTLAGTLFATRLADGGSYSVKATVLDSNGIRSAQVTSAFSVDYTEPVAAVPTVTYLPDIGWAQIGLVIPAAGGGLVAAAYVTIDRIIDGISENVVTRYVSAHTLTILDTSPTIAGVNVYRITTISSDGAATVVTVSLPVDEEYWAFLSTGDGFSTVVKFFGNLKFTVTPTRDSAQVRTAGRKRAIALFGDGGSFEIRGSVDLDPEFGSTAQEIEQFLLDAGVVCYRDPSGQRVFGAVSGSVSHDSGLQQTFSFKVVEAS